MARTPSPLSRPKRRRPHLGLLALSASAVSAIYGVGYAHTQDIDTQLASQGAPALAAPIASPSAPLVVPTVTNGAAATPTAVPAPSVAPPARSSRAAASPPTQVAAAPPAAPPTITASAPATASAYRDGTYAGSGTSRFGNVEVSVAVQAGRITSVALTRVTTKYPASRIAALPSQVVARQSAQIDNVSGATASASAFRQAVQAALTAAR